MLSYLRAVVGVAGPMGAFLAYLITIERRLSRIEGYCRGRCLREKERE